MPKVLAVFGATGQQGGSVVDFVLNDPQLSKEYQIRALTRDPTSEISKQLSDKVEVVKGDANDPVSLDSALAGAHTVFAITNPSFGPDAFQAEFESGKVIADAAVKQGAQYIIFSSLPSVKEISGGKYTKVTNFDSKAAVEKYIRSLPIKSAFFVPGEFMENFHKFPFYALAPQPDGSYVMSRSNAPTSTTPLINATEDTGKFVGAILAEPNKFNGEVIIGATAFYSLTEVAEIISKSTGKRVVYKEVTFEEYHDSLPDFIADVFVEAISFIGEYGYFGPGSDKLLETSVQQARGKLTTFEEYLSKHPIELA